MFENDPFLYELVKGLYRPLSLASAEKQKRPKGQNTYSQEGETVKRWARNYDRCGKCHTTRRRHKARGFCAPCYKELYREARAAESQIRKKPNPFPIEHCQRAHDDRFKLGLSYYESANNWLFGFPPMYHEWLSMSEYVRTC